MQEVFGLITIFFFINSYLGGFGGGVTRDIDFFFATPCREGILSFGNTWFYWNLFQGLLLRLDLLRSI